MDAYIKIDLKSESNSSGDKTLCRSPTSCVRQNWCHPTTYVKQSINDTTAYNRPPEQTRSMTYAALLEILECPDLEFRVLKLKGLGFRVYRKF